MEEQRDTDGSFRGFEPRECREHRTVGPHRAWCFDCAEWCYPHAPCVRCEAATLRDRPLVIHHHGIEAHAESYHEGYAEAMRQVQPELDALDRVRDLHRPWYEFDGQRHDHVVSVAGDDIPEGHVCRVGGWDSCDPKYEEHLVLACVECRQTTEDAEPGYPLWPCDTIRALDAAPDPTREDQRRERTSTHHG